MSAANDTVDQSADNLEIVSNILSATSSLAISGNLTADDSVSCLMYSRPQDMHCETNCSR